MFSEISEYGGLGMLRSLREGSLDQIRERRDGIQTQKYLNYFVGIRECFILQKSNISSMF